MQQDQKKNKSLSSTLKVLSAVAGLAIILFAIFLLIFRPKVLDIRGMGYAGAFFISVLGGSTILIPIPTMAFIFALGGILKYPLLVGIAAGVGETVGELAGYIAGWEGAEPLRRKNFKFFTKLTDWTKQHGFLGLLVLAAVPNPFFLLTAATAGALHYSLWKFLLSTGVGKTIKGIMVAYAGALGLNIILRLWPG